MTVPWFAAEHGIKPNTVRKHLRAMGIPREGRDYQLSPAIGRRVLAAMAAAKVGRPRLTRP